jgi:hypothetical protein
VAGRDGDDAETSDIGGKLFEAATRGKDDATELLTCLIGLGRHDDAGLARLLVRRARRAYYASHDEQAVKDSTRAIRLDPDYGAAYAVRGAVNGYLANYDQSLADFART